MLLLSRSRESRLRLTKQRTGGASEPVPCMSNRRKFSRKLEHILQVINYVSGFESCNRQKLPPADIEADDADVVAQTGRDRLPPARRPEQLKGGRCSSGFSVAYPTSLSSRHFRFSTSVLG